MDLKLENPQLLLVIGSWISGVHFLILFVLWCRHRSRVFLLATFFCALFLGGLAYSAHLLDAHEKISIFWAAVAFPAVLELAMLMDAFSGAASRIRFDVGAQGGACAIALLLTAGGFPDRWMGWGIALGCALPLFRSGLRPWVARRGAHSLLVLGVGFQLVLLGVLALFYANGVDQYSWILSAHIALLFGIIGLFAFVLATAIEQATRGDTVASMEDRALAVLKSTAQLAELGEQSAMVAHEIKNLLTVISSRATLLRKYLQLSPPNYSRAEEAARGIEDVSRKISDMTRGLLGALGNRDQDPRVEVLVSRVLRDVIALCEGRLRQKGISFQVEEGPVDARILARPLQLVQVLVNLLNNAADAVDGLENRWVRLKVHEDGDSLLFEVTDSGPGVPESIREKIFEPLFTTKPEGKGTGLGLVISRRIAEEHDGTLHLDHRSECTRFVMRLPKVRQLVGCRVNESLLGKRDEETRSHQSLGNRD